MWRGPEFLFPALGVTISLRTGEEGAGAEEHDFFSTRANGEMKGGTKYLVESLLRIRQPPA